jgi:hypothetical protein
MIDPNDYFGPPPKKAPPETEEEKVAAFKAIKAKLAAADPAASINRVMHRGQKAADEAKTIPTKARHLQLALDELKLLKKDELAKSPPEELQANSEEYAALMAFVDEADRAMARLRLLMAQLELEGEKASVPEPAPAMPEPKVSPVEATAVPDQMNAEQLAQYIHRSKDVVYRYAREGKIPTIWIDTHPLFSKKAIDEWLDSRLDAGKPKGDQAHE